MNLEIYAWTTQEDEIVHRVDQRNTWPGDDWRFTTEFRDGLSRTWRQDVARTNTGKLVLSSIIDLAELEGAMTLELVSLGGASTLSSTLLGAGIRGTAYTLTHTHGNFQWKQYGIAEAEGAVSGLVSGGIGEMGEDYLISEEASTATEIATKTALGVGGGAVGDVAGQVTGNLLTGHAPFHQYSWSSTVTSASEGGFMAGADSATDTYLEGGESGGGSGAGSEIEMTEMQ